MAAELTGQVVAGWGMKTPVVVADAAYGTHAHLRRALAERGLAYVLAIRSDVSAHSFETKPIAPARNGPVGCWPQPATGRPHRPWQPWPPASDRRHSPRLLGCPTCRPTPRSPTWSVSAKVRWRIEHGYRELKHCLGLDHFEGRSRPGWHHHVTLVTAAFLTEQRLAQKRPRTGLTLYQVLDALQDVL
ncbi:transposase [Streptomyces sp. WAC 01325]|uniref:transposase n=1 Tax=Streptomyces sp. WAC 01325 TaxID=2203202 RepID=UPI0037DA1C5A